MTPLVNEVALYTSEIKIKQLVKGKSVLYVATTYRDYLRVQQELNIIKEVADDLRVVVSNHKSYFVRLFYVYFKLIFSFNKNEVVFIGFAPQLILPFLKLRFRGKEIIIDFFISVYDTFVNDRKKVKPNSFLAGLMHRLDQVCLKWADWVISDTKAHAEYFTQEFSCDEEKIITLYLQADSKYYYPQSISKPNELENQFVVLYFGSVLPLQGTEVLIEAINICKIQQISFVLIGPFDTKKCKNSNVQFFDWIPQSELARLIAFSDLCLAGHFHPEIDKAKRTIPGKAYLYEAMQKPMILGDTVANKERYPKNYSKIDFVKLGSPEELLKAIEKRYHEWKA